MADPNMRNYMGAPMGQQNPSANLHRVYEEAAGRTNEVSSVAPLNYNTPELTTNGVCKKFIHGKCRQG